MGSFSRLNLSSARAPREPEAGLARRLRKGSGRPLVVEVPTDAARPGPSCSALDFKPDRYSHNDEFDIKSPYTSSNSFVLELLQRIRMEIEAVQGEHG